MLYVDSKCIYRVRKQIPVWDILIFRFTISLVWRPWCWATWNVYQRYRAIRWSCLVCFIFVFVVLSLLSHVLIKFNKCTNKMNSLLKGFCFTLHILCSFSKSDISLVKYGWIWADDITDQREAFRTSTNTDPWGPSALSLPLHSFITTLWWLTSASVLRCPRRVIMWQLTQT